MKKAKCVFDTKVFDNTTYTSGCSALTERICDRANCSFYKSSAEYELTYDGHCQKKRGNE